MRARSAVASVHSTSSKRPHFVERLEPRQMLTATYHLTYDSEFNSVNLANGGDQLGFLGRDNNNNTTYPANYDDEYFSNPIYQPYNPFSTSAGILSVTATQLSTLPTSEQSAYSTTTHYLSGVISTGPGSPTYSNNFAKGFSQEYGYFEIRAKLSNAKGAWPAFWLMPTPGGAGELDVFEELGIDPTAILENQHAAGATDPQFKEVTSDSSAAFHTYGLEWTPTSVNWYIDGTEVHHENNYVNNPMYALIGMEVEGAQSYGGYGGPANPAAFPANMQVDYLHIYSSDDSVPAAVPQPGYTASLPAAVGTIVTGTNFSQSDVGSPSLTGLTKFDNANIATVTPTTFGGSYWTVEGAGTGIGGTTGTDVTDQFTFLSEPSNGDTSLIGDVASLTNAGSSSRAGLMIRSDSTANGAFASITRTMDNHIVFQTRAAVGAAVTSVSSGVVSAGVYLKLNRSGNTFSAWYSLDKQTWTQVGSNTIAAVTTSCLAGLAVSGQGSSTLAVADITGFATYGPLTDYAAIGTTASLGAARYDGTTYTVGGSGTGLAGTSDQLTSVSANLSGNQSLITEISSLGTATAAAAGLELRSSSADGSINAALTATPSSGLDFSYRTSTGGSTATTTLAGVAAPTASAPLWLELTEVNGIVTASYNTGVSPPTTWLAVGSEAIPFAGGYSGGLAVASGSATTITTALFSNLSITGVGLPLADADIGARTAAGSASFDGTTWTVNGAGAGPGATTDQLNQVSESLTGNGSIIARVVAQTQTYTWAPVGIMLRNDTSATAAYASLNVTPSGRVFMDWRTTNGGTNSSYDAGSATPGAPTWVKLTRTGQNVDGYLSSDGVTWTKIDGTAITLTGLNATAIGGLFAASHVSNIINTATFTDFDTPGFTVGAVVTRQDIGAPAIAGTSTIDGSGNDTLTSSSSGLGVWNGTTYADQFNYLSQTMNGNGTLTTHVDSLVNGGGTAWAQVGLMVRNSNSNTSPWVALNYLSNGRLSFAYGAGGVRATTVATLNITGPVWLKMTRTDNTFTAWYSTDGTHWINFSSTSAQPIAATVLAGIDMFSSSTSYTASAVIDSFALLQD